VAEAAPRVKICGVCRAADAALAGAAGADYVGVILAPGYGRTLTVDDAAVVLAAATSLRAGVFVDGTRETVAEAADRLGLDVIQLHGSETPEAAHALRSPRRIVWKAVRVKHAADVHAAIERYAGCVDGLLLDGWSAAAAGGTGARFDWAAVAAQRAAWPAGLDLIAAGGLSPENVGRAVAQLAPDVVDVSSGVESAPREKSAERVREFIEAARGAAGNRGG
jgi:phosphoribosylanthranilate isomerase